MKILPSPLYRWDCTPEPPASEGQQMEMRSSKAAANSAALPKREWPVTTVLPGSRPSSRPKGTDSPMAGRSIAVIIWLTVQAQAIIAPESDS